MLSRTLFSFSVAFGILIVLWYTGIRSVYGLRNVGKQMNLRAQCFKGLPRPMVVKPVLQWLSTRMSRNLEPEVENIKKRISSTESALKQAETSGKSDDLILSIRQELVELRKLAVIMYELENKECYGGIENFRWKAEQTTLNTSEEEKFPLNGLGKRMLGRHRVIALVEAARAKQMHKREESASVYIPGCHGVGKTCLLMLLAQHYSQLGWEVFWFNTAAEIPVGLGREFQQYARDHREKKVAVIIDEVDANPDAGLFTALLKANLPNVFTIGAAVPRYLSMGTSSYFRSTILPSDLVLRVEDDDVRGLLAQWTEMLRDTPGVHGDLVQVVSEEIISYCGGHAFPTLAFMEFFFTTTEGRQVLTAGKKGIGAYLRSGAFMCSDTYREVCRRCFAGASADRASRSAYMRISCGGDVPTDVDALVRLGWWDPDMVRLSSPLLRNILLSCG